MKKRKLITAVFAVLVAAAAIAAAAAFSMRARPLYGTVTDSDTGKAIAGVCVTDGRNVVKTDENGRFSLDGWRKSHFVTVTVPSGYQTDEFYLPVEGDRESYDFTLEKSDVTSSEQHCFLQISDTEIGAQGTGEWLEQLKGLVEKTNPAFLIHTGDICYEDGLRLHIEQMNSSTMGCTVRYVIGNHDYVSGDFGEQLYESLYGPVWYSFDVGNIHYVVTSFQTGSDYPSAYSKNDRWRWLENDLAQVDADKRVVMFNHTKAPSDDYVISFGKNEIDLKEHNLAAWIYGHYHYNYVNRTDGVLSVSTARPDCGGIDSSVAGARLISVSEDGEISTKMYYYGANDAAPAENAVWRTELSGNVLFCDAVYSQGFVYTATADDDYPRECAIYCIDAETGKIMWSHETENSVKNNILVYEDKVVAMDADANIYCLNASDGSPVWEPMKVQLSEGVGTSSGICIENGVVFAGNARSITAIDLDSRTVKWTVNRKSGENSPAEFVLANGRLIVSSHWDALVALDTQTGKELWSSSDEDLRFRSSTPAVVDDSTLLVADSDAVMLVSLENGDILSKTELEGYNFSSGGQAVCIGSVAYIPTANKGLAAFSIEEKKLLWTYETGESVVFSAPYTGKGSKTVQSSVLVSEGRLIFGANDGFIHIVNAENGSLIKKINAGSPVLSKAAVENGKIFAGTFSGSALCFED